MAICFNGKTEAISILDSVDEQVYKLSKQPKLTIFYSTTHPAQMTFCAIKEKTAKRLGILTEIKEFPKAFDEYECEKLIKQESQTADGILVQLPLSAALNKFTVLNSIPYEKDVEGLSAKRMGFLYQSTPDVYSPVSKACMHAIHSALRSLNQKLETQTVTLVGNSYLAGKALSTILSRECKSLTICNHHTTNLREITIRSDIIVSVTGKPWIITEEMINEDAILIDVGYVPQDNGSVLGDFSPEATAKSAFYTPVPGGIGPLTVAYIFDNLMHLIRERTPD